MKKPEKLNLVPILDSVFIFIFFLLMSAQFVEIYEIGSTLPMLKENSKDKNDKDPLNLTIEINENQIVVKTGLRSTNLKTFSIDQKSEIKAYLLDLKKKNPSEKTMILRADPRLRFQNLISFIDTTQSKKEGELFSQIVFDNNGLR